MPLETIFGVRINNDINNISGWNKGELELRKGQLERECAMHRNYR